MLRSPAVGNYAKHSPQSLGEASPDSARLSTDASGQQGCPLWRPPQLTEEKEAKIKGVTSREDLIINDISHLKGESFTTRIHGRGAGGRRCPVLPVVVWKAGRWGRLLFAQGPESGALSEMRDGRGAAGYPRLRSAEEDPRVQTGNTLSTPGNNNSTQFTLGWPVCRALPET